MATALTIRNPVIYAYHRLALGPLRDLLHPDGSRIRVSGELRVARSPLELVNYVERGSDLVLVEDTYSQRELVRGLSHTMSELMTTIETVMERVQRLLKEDPHNEELADPVAYNPTLQVLAERMMNYTRTLDGAGIDVGVNVMPILPGITEVALTDPQAGLRPATADNLPALGATALPGLVLAIGHFRNGVLLSPVTADAVAAVLAGEALPAVARTFTPDRLTAPPARARASA